MEDETKDVPKGYALSGKIMLSAIVVLFFVVVLMVILHLYARWYLLRARRRQNHLRRMRQRQRRNQIVFHEDFTNTEASTGASAGLSSSAQRGLDASVLSLLPVFVYSSKTHPEPIDCAVCLSEFEDNETGRVLPKCSHTFHIDCIDMWFHSHSTCPLCRSAVEPAESRVETVVVVDQPRGIDLGTSSGVYSDCRYETASEEDNTASTSSSSSTCDRNKASAFMGITIEVPRRNWSIGRSEDESGRCDSPSTQSSFRSPMSRMLSFKRMLSRERRANSNSQSSSSVNAVSCSSVTEPILSDGGGRVETQ